MTPPIAPPKRQDPRQTIQPGDSIHTATTLPQQDAVRDPRREPESGQVLDSGRGPDAPPKTLADLDERNAMRMSNFMGALREDLRKRDARIEGKIDEMALEVSDLRVRTSKLEAGQRAYRVRAPSINDRETPEEASALSTDERFERLDRAALRAKEAADEAKDAAEERARRNKLHTAIVGFAVITLGALGNVVTTRLTTPDVVRDAVKDTAPIIEGATKKAIEDAKP